MFYVGTVWQQSKMEFNLPHSKTSITLLRRCEIEKNRKGSNMITIVLKFKYKFEILGKDNNKICTL